MAFNLTRAATTAARPHRRAYLALIARAEFANVHRLRVHPANFLWRGVMSKNCISAGVNGKTSAQHSPAQPRKHAGRCANVNGK
jgi:hypothetical protein